VLFIHSAIADSQLWDREFPLYAKDYRTVRFDLRGYGGSSLASSEFSYVEDIRALLAHLGVTKSFLVGSSMGGAYAIDFALAYPEMVDGMLLVAPGLSGGFEPPYDDDEKAAFGYDDRKSREVAEAWSKGDKAGAFERLRELWCSSLEGPSLALFRRMVEQNAPEVFEDRSSRRATQPPPAYGRLSSIRVPTTLLVGDKDNPSSVCIAKRIAKAIPGAGLVVVPGADHLINLSRPEQFDAELRSALAARL